MNEFRNLEVHILIELALYSSEIHGILDYIEIVRDV